MPKRASVIKTTLLLDGLAFPESPRWHDDRLWFSDMYACQVMTITPDGKSETIVAVPHQPSGLGWLPDGRLLMVSMVDRRLLRLDPAGLTVVADLLHLAPFHCTDMVVDRHVLTYLCTVSFDIF